MLVHQNHADGGENGSIMVGMFVSLCLASQKPSEREFFVPAGTDLGVKLFAAAIMTVAMVLAANSGKRKRRQRWPKQRQRKGRQQSTKKR